MKLLNLISLAPLATAFVVPNQQTFQELSIETDSKYAQARKGADSLFDGIKADFNDLLDSAKSKAGSVKDTARSALDDALAFSQDVGSSWAEEVVDARSWMENNVEHLHDLAAAHEGHHGPPREEPPHDKPPHDKPPHDGPPHHDHPHKPHHPHHKSNLTVYQLISESKYTTKFAKWINEYPDLVEALNGTEANYTVFAPTDKAFEKIPDHDHKPDKEKIKQILSYHVSPDFYPAGRVLVTHTVPTLLKSDQLTPDGEAPQRLSFNIGLRGLTVNFYSRIVAVDIFGTNGVIHGVDSVIFPPPAIGTIISLLPSEFSTLELGMERTGLAEGFKKRHPGGTFFAPNNFAFVKLGPKVNAFLFSKYGEKYLKALLQYHIAPGTTLYSDAVYGYKGDDDDDKSMTPSLVKELFRDSSKGHCKGKANRKDKSMSKQDNKMDKEDHSPPKGYYHFDLPTLLEGRKLNVDVARYAGFILIKINGFARVVVEDGIARDGVIQVVGDVLVPPKKFPGAVAQAAQGELSVEDLKERLEPYLE